MVLANGTLSKENDMSYLYNQVSDRDGIIAAYVTQYGPCLSVTAGTMTSDATYFYYTFLDTGTIKFPRTISATVLIVGGEELEEEEWEAEAEEVVFLNKLSLLLQTPHTSQR